MEILHKRTVNNEQKLIANLSQGEIGLVLSKDTENTKIILKNDKDEIEEIYSTSHPINCGEWCSEFFSLEHRYAGAPVTSLNVSDLDVTCCKNMRDMFNNCTSLTSLDLSNLSFGSSACG